ncbi:DUF547 domain-containing protein [Jiella marina]|uniref:DUF547 domain-containing protein n=1 Tax=Jiella sp. LLJ827 TaxID=2917712 RepID=UPI0021019178|nr:DUF547 domain-containing protein [Jiella sp. LLJ827]MCQ0989841.1 DUF547 domain-containing protein [Jiella sp. LLJ827]
MGLAMGTASSAHAFEAKPFDVTELNDRADADIARAFAGAAKEETIAVDDAAYRQFLSAYVVDRPGALNLVRYGDVTPADREALKRQIAEWEALEWKKLTAAQKFAFFANLYNAVTLDVVLDHYPVDSIRDIEIGTEDRGFFASLSSAFNRGPWSAKRVRIGEVELSLDDIEHAILRPMGHPRVHYAVNCASVGCPDLRPDPWAAETLDADLDAAARAYVNSERGLRESPGGGLLASRIYDWFGEDFGGEAGLRAHLERYAEGEAAALLSGEDPEIVGYRYDWSLNDASRQ